MKSEEYSDERLSLKHNFVALREYISISMASIFCVGAIGLIFLNQIIASCVCLFFLLIFMYNYKSDKAERNRIRLELFVRNEIKERNKSKVK